MKSAFKTIILLSVLTILLNGCYSLIEDWSIFDPKTFDEREIGEVFFGSRDGHYEKLPNNYCIRVDLGTEASLFKVPDEFISNQWDTSVGNYNIVLKGHFIKGYFTSQYYVLCEEKENGDVLYLTFDFSNEEVRYYEGTDEICKLLNVDSIPWSSLCNTNAQRNRK